MKTMKKNLVIILLTMVVFYTTAAEETPAAEDPEGATTCPDGWSKLSTGCYLAKESPMTWDEARKFCTDLQAEMVVLESEEEIKEVAKMTADLIKKKWRFWVDGKMINKAWKTHKGEKTPSFTPWGKVTNSFVGDCIRTGGDTRWYKALCDSKVADAGYTINPFCKKAIEKSSKASITKNPVPGWVEFKQMEEMEVKDKVDLTTLPFVGKEFSVSLEFLMNAIPTGTYGSILHLTLGTDCSKRGDRIPAVWVGVDGSLIVVSDLNPTNACGQGFNTISQLKDIGTGKWVKLDISQKPTERQYDANGKEMDEKYKFEVFLNGASVVSVENPEPVKYENVKVLADDSQFNYKPLDGKIRNLVIRSKDTPAPAA